jgi:hypothetical protein
MTERVGLEVDTLTIRILIRLQRRGGCKLIVMPEGAVVPTPKPRRDEPLIKALVRPHRWEVEGGQAKSITDLAEQGGHGRLRLPAPAAHLRGARHRGGDPGRAAAEGAEAGRDPRERAAGVEEQRATWGFRSFRGHACGTAMALDEIKRGMPRLKLSCLISLDEARG